MKKKRKYPTYRELVMKNDGNEPSGNRQNTHWSNEIASKCYHKWQPLSFSFETQLLDGDGRVRIRQPNLSNGKVYCVCMKCYAHTYIMTGWIGYNIGSPDLLEDNEDDAQDEK